MLIVSVILGATFFGLLASWDALTENDNLNSTADSRTGSIIYSVPIPNDAKNSTAPVYGGSDTPIYLEEKVGASEYTQREDSRSFGR